MALARADDRQDEAADEACPETAIEAALAAFVPAAEAAPAWGDVLRRAAALPVCTCSSRSGMSPIDAESVHLTGDPTWP
jgi:hypothetical protein